MKIVRQEPDPQDLEWYRESLKQKKSARVKGLIFIVLCVMLVFATVAYGAVDAWAMALLSIFACFVVLLWIADSFIEKEFRFSANPLQIPILGLILIGFIQLLPLRGAVEPDLLSIPATYSISLDPYATRFFIILLFVNLIFFAAALNFIDSRKKLRLIVFTIIIFGSLMAFFGVIQSLASSNPNSILGIRESSGALPFATFVNRHHFAAFMNMTIGLTLGLLYGGATKKDKRLLLIIALILMGIALIFTGSRGGILSLFGVVGFVVLINILQKDGDDEFDEKPSFFRRNFILIGGGLALILVLFGSVLMLGGDSWLMRGVGLGGGEADISNGRTHFWFVALQIILHHPILGAGLDAFGAAFPQYDTWNGNFRVEQAHNEYLQILADAGIFGFLCVAAFIYFLFKKGLRIVRTSGDVFRKSVATGALAGCFGILIHNFFDFPLRTSSNGLFFLMLAALATISIKEDSTSAQSKRRRRIEIKAGEESTS
ncbi:MAG: O-antigen ligase family protein [Pyrinomonadaceae bacterium]